MTGSTRTPSAASANSAPCLARRRAAVSGETARVIGVTNSDLPNIPRRSKPLARWLAVFAAGVLAAVLVIAVTQPPGPGLDPDSASYVGAAQSLARGNGYRVPIAAWWTADSTAPLAHFPPGYPTAIALPMMARVAPVQSARFVNAAAAFIDVAVATLLIAQVSGLVTALIAALAILVMRPFVLAHLSILSEPLFLAELVATLAVMVATTTVDGRERLQRVLLAGLLGALTTLTRYAGIAIGGAVVIWMLW